MQFHWSFYDEHEIHLFILDSYYPYIRFVKEVMSRKWYIFKKLLSIEKITIVESNNGEIERKTSYKQEL